MNLSSQNRLIRQYFECLRRHAQNLNSIEKDDEIRQDIALCIFMSITTVEAFLNVFFRILVEEKQFLQYKEIIMKEIRGKELHYKIEKWPEMFFGKAIVFASGIGKDFIELKKLRNKLVHFNPKYERVSFSHIEINGLADTTIFDDLETKHAIHAVNVAEGILEEIFRLRGIKEDKIPHAMHLWTGKVPI